MRTKAGVHQHQSAKKFFFPDPGKEKRLDTAGKRAQLEWLGSPCFQLGVSLRHLQLQPKIFVHLIDEFYERNLNLIISAAALPTALYSGERFALQFQRTVSRLQEMQSRDYLAREHLP